MKRKFQFISTIFIAITLFISPVYTAFAQEVTISDNGSGSTSSVAVTQNNTTNVSQSNDTQINNNLAVDTNTGGNTASNNTNAESQINTGDINTTTTVTNSANTSVVSDQCCGASTPNVSLTGNGQGSQNTVNINNNNQSNIGVSQTAVVGNSVGIEVNSGNNGILGNTGGSSSIITGDIKVTDIIKNQDINSAKVSSGQVNTTADPQLVISGNGAKTDNFINIVQNNQCCNVDINNFAFIENNDYIMATSGNNIIGDNIDGDVSIITGDILIEKLIKSGPINSSEVVCCEEVKPTPSPTPTPSPPPSPTPTPTPSPAPTTPGVTSNPPSAGGPAAAAGEVLGAAIAGEVLPISGSSVLLKLTIFSILLFILGLYLQSTPAYIRKVK